MKSLFCPKLSQDTMSPRVSVGLLLLRLIIGVGFIVHGSGKILSPMAWMGPDAPVPGIFQALAAISEFGGGIALLLGAVTPCASAAIMATMAVAVFFHVSKGDGFLQGFELAAVYLFIAACLFLVGPGTYSVDAYCAKKCKKT